MVFTVNMVYTVGVDIVCTIDRVYVVAEGAEGYEGAEGAMGLRKLWAHGGYGV